MLQLSSAIPGLVLSILRKMYVSAHCSLFSVIGATRATPCTAVTLCGLHGVSVSALGLPVCSKEQKRDLGLLLGGVVVWCVTFAKA